MMGRILFAWYQGSSLDSNSKMWRLYADVLNDISFFVDLLSPMFSKGYSIYFIYVCYGTKSIRTYYFNVKNETPIIFESFSKKLFIYLF